MTEEKRTLIETFLPVDEISEEAKKEKQGRAPTFEMHYWWTRKPLITARAAVLGALLPADFDPQEFKKLLGFEHVSVTGKRAHNYDIPPERIEQLKKEYKKVWVDVPTILDPFAGGGSIPPFEAMRAGVNTVANDYNPVAHLIEKATLVYPQKYGEQLYKDVEKGLIWVFKETQKEMEQYYPKHKGKDVVAYIWAWSVRCPKCGFCNPLVGQWWLVNNEKKKRFIDPLVENENLELFLKEGNGAQEGTCAKGIGRCLKCNSTIPNDIIKNDILKNEREILLCKVVLGKNGKEYELASKEDIIAYKECKKVLDKNWVEYVKERSVPTEYMPDDSRGAIWAKLYLEKWHKLLNYRQKLLFITLVKKIWLYSDILLRENNEEYQLAIATYLSFIFGKHIDYNSRSACWNRPKEIITSSMSKRGVALSWDHAEVNPFVKGSGTLISINKAILDGLDYSIRKLYNRGNVRTTLGSVTTLKDPIKIIISDPPYLDDVIYAEFSELFYSWEKIALNKFIQLGEVQKSEEMSVGGVGGEGLMNSSIKCSDFPVKKCTKYWKMMA